MLNKLPDATLQAVPNQVGSGDKEVWQFQDTDYLGSAGHNWFEVWDIGVTTLTGSNVRSVSPGLAAGQTQVINTDQTPDYWLITVSGDPDCQAYVYTGPAAGGPPMRLGNAGSAKIPARGQNYLTLVQAGPSGTLYGTIIAVAGFTTFDLSFSGSTGPRQTGQTGTFNVVSVAIAGQLVLPANPLRKSALFINLGANSITLGKIAAPAAGSGIVLATGSLPFNDSVTTDAWFATAATAATNLLVMEVI